jgi:hypothetical protein
VAPGPKFLVNRCNRYRRVQSSARGACLPAPPDFIFDKRGSAGATQWGTPQEREIYLRQGALSPRGTEREGISRGTLNLQDKAAGPQHQFSRKRAVIEFWSVLFWSNDLWARSVYPLRLVSNPAMPRGHSTDWLYGPVGEHMLGWVKHGATIENSRPASVESAKAA